jgi:hypothetical protein
MNSNKIITRIRHQSIPDYFSAVRAKVAEFGKGALTAYDEPKSLVLGFKCGDEIHLIGLNNIRAHYKIERTFLQNIPGAFSWRRDTSPTISENDGVKMFGDDFKKALNGE